MSLAKYFFIFCVLILMFCTKFLFSCSNEILNPEINIYIDYKQDKQEDLKNLILEFSANNNLKLDNKGKNQPKMNGEEFLWLDLYQDDHLVMTIIRKNLDSQYAIAFYNHDKKGTWEDLSNKLLPILDSQWGGEIKIKKLQ